MIGFPFPPQYAFGRRLKVELRRRSKVCAPEGHFDDAPIGLYEERA